MTISAPRVEVQLQASQTCYLSNEPPFYVRLDIEDRTTDDPTVYVQDHQGDKGHQLVSLNKIIQCFDDEADEQVKVLSQDSQLSILDRGPVILTTSSNLKPDEFPFTTSSLRPDRKYRLHFKPMGLDPQWPSSIENPSLEPSANSVSKTTTRAMPWEAAAGNDTVYFRTRSSQKKPPNISVSMFAPATYSLSKPFTFTLKFSTDYPTSITVLADRALVQADISDIEILDAESRTPLGDRINICREDDGPQRDEFLTIDGTYTEHRELDFTKYMWKDINFKIGKEYILRHLGGNWWWTEDSIDEVMAYLESKGSFDLDMTGAMEFAGADEVRFMVVE